MNVSATELREIPLPPLEAIKEICNSVILSNDFSADNANKIVSEQFEFTPVIIWSKLDEARKILKQLGLPTAQQKEISAYTLLALCGIKARDSWSKATRKSLKVTKGIMAFVLDVHKKEYAPNTRETFRRQVLHQFVQARIADYNPDNPKLPVISPNAHYVITNEALEASCFTLLLS